MSDSLSVAVSCTWWLIRKVCGSEHPARARRAGPTAAHELLVSCEDLGAAHVRRAVRVRTWAGVRDTEIGRSDHPDVEHATMTGPHLRLFRDHGRMTHARPDACELYGAARGITVQRESTRTSKASAEAPLGLALLFSSDPFFFSALNAARTTA